MSSLLLFFLSLSDSTNQWQEGDNPEASEVKHSKSSLCSNSAVLVSGELHRFYWRDQFLPHDTFPCPVDVYIVLHESADESKQIALAGSVPVRGSKPPEASARRSPSRHPTTASRSRRASSRPRTTRSRTSPPGRGSLHRATRAQGPPPGFAAQCRTEIAKIDRRSRLADQTFVCFFKSIWEPQGDSI